MRRFHRVTLLIALIALSPALTACENFDLDKLDVFGLSDKKKLPGDRKPLFPEGVPGVSQGVPPELVKGYQPPPEPAQAAETPAEPVKPKPRPKRKVTAAPRPAAASQQTTPSPWPDQQPAAKPAQTEWPAPPPPGTFSR